LNRRIYSRATIAVFGHCAVAKHFQKAHYFLTQFSCNWGTNEGYTHKLPTRCASFSTWSHRWPCGRKRHLFLGTSTDIQIPNISFHFQCVIRI